jgi:hypothetical protein
LRNAAPRVKEARRMIEPGDVKFPFLCGRMLRQEIEVLKNFVLPDGFAATLPLDECEFGNATIGL